MPSTSYAPMVLPRGQVRDTRSYTRFGTRPVELVTSDPRGDELQGWMRVPKRYALAKPHTNEHLELEDFIAAQLKRWCEWREHLGWTLNSTPKVRGPVDAPVSDPNAETPDYKLYIATAYFKPKHVILAGFTDVAEIERQAAVFGVNLWDPKPYSSLQGQRTRAVIHETRPFADPMVIAEQRRQQYGLKREDLLIGPLAEPWKEPS